MHIKPLIVAAGAGACLFLISSALAAAQPEAAPESTEEAQSAVSDPEAPPTMQVETARATETQAGPIRNTRPRVERHRDARACLEAGDNGKIIKCANKYR